MNRVAMVVCMNKTLKYLLSPILRDVYKRQQLGERLPYKQRVTGSSPVSSI